MSLLLLMAAQPMVAQVEMSIMGELTLQPSDADASSNYRQTDSDDNVCSLIKVKTTNPMGAVLVLQTGGGIAPVPPPEGITNSQQDGSWWYWLSPKTRNIFFTAEGYTETAPLGVRLQAGKVYELKLKVGAAKKTIDTFKLDEPVLTLNITPEDCVVSYGEDDHFDMGVRTIKDGHFKEALAYGTYQIKVENPFYETYIGTHRFDADTRESSISLRPLHSLLSFESNPAGAEVYMDGSVDPIGKTPFTSGRISKGKHSFRVFKENYYGCQMEYDVNSDGSVQSVPLIVLKPQFGVVTCVCDDADATLTVTDAVGKIIGQGQSGLRLELNSRGNYKLEASKLSHNSQSISIQGGISLEGQELTVSIGAPIPIYGGLAVTSEPMHAELWIDGEKVGNTNWEGKLLIGEHRIELAKEDYFLEPFMVNILENENLSVSKIMNEGTVPSLLGTESANCYIVSKAGNYYFYTVKGNSMEPVGPVEKVEVLWESFGTDVAPSIGDIIKSVSFAEGTNVLPDEVGIVTFSTPATLKNGNAVIAAKDAKGDILWSWHIWVCKGYAPNATAQVYYNNAGTMMDRNLGAISSVPGTVGSLGLFYQWGRKDPFLSSSSILSDMKVASTLRWPSPVKSTSRNGTVDFAVKHPTTFIKGTKGTQEDWIYSQRDDALWQSTKTIYDPCPPGWKVPEGGEDGVWSEAVGNNYWFDHPYDSTNKGMNFSGKFGSTSTIWYPAAGWLGCDDGRLCCVGSYGWCWSCTPSGRSAYNLDLSNLINTGKVSPSSSVYRANGQSVRCVQE
ncbi:MAG: PEGA domain-containing protein [Bacteroidales bacterium]|nr:PEGA domain-containing protein [Bacteroidales bacterium]